MTPTLEEQDLLADSFHRAGSQMTARERAAELILGGGFVAATAAVVGDQPAGLIPDAYPP